MKTKEEIRDEICFKRGYQNGKGEPIVFDDLMLDFDYVTAISVLEETIELYADQFKPKKVKPIEQRHMEFADKLNYFVGEFPHSMIDEFRAYWSEYNEGGRKMRFEKEKVFDIKKRLERWAKNQKTFNNGKSTKPTTDEAVNGFISH